MAARRGDGPALRPVPPPLLFGLQAGLGDILLGTAALAAEVNNVHKASHVREKLAEIIMITELGYAAGYTASDLGKPEVYMPGVGFVPYGPGSYIPNSIYCNVGRCLSGEAVFREAEILCDIAGGVVATFPHEKDFMNPEIKGLLLQVHQTESEHVGGGSGPVLAVPGRRPLLGKRRGSQNWRYHGGGSPIMEQIAITTQYDIESRKKLVKYIAGMSGGDREALSKKGK